MKSITNCLMRMMMLFTFITLLNCGSDSIETSPEIIEQETEEQEEEEEQENVETITINSIEELTKVLAKSDINVVMTPGVYAIGPDDVTSGLLPDSTIFEITGKNCNYDFTGVTFEFDTAIFRSYGKVEVIEMRVVGQNNVIKNLTMADIGDGNPYKTALGVQLDGLDNRIEGLHISARGSFPYGYGDIFGKGAGSVIFHYKHSSILVRGERNHLKNCTVVQKCYGHGVFVQGGIDTLIEGCHLYGDTPRTTDDVLAELGTGSRADQVGFMTAWGYKLTAGWMFSKQEDGIRAYNTGAHYLTGETTHTKNMRVLDCTINNFRSGVTIGFCDGIKYVENCVATGTENAFWVGSEGVVKNCSGDAIYGPLYATAYSTDSNSSIDLTLIDSEREVYGRHPVLYLGGNGLTVSLKSTETNPKKNIDILVSGIRQSIRFEEGRDATYYKQDAINMVLKNHTNYSVILNENSKSSTVESCANVVNNGTGNTITNVTCN
jgi:hypothetical protein